MKQKRWLEVKAVVGIRKRQDSKNVGRRLRNHEEEMGGGSP